MSTMSARINLSLKFSANSVLASEVEQPTRCHRSLSPRGSLPHDPVPRPCWERPTAAPAWATVVHSRQTRTLPRAWRCDGLEPVHQVVCSRQVRSLCTTSKPKIWPRVAAMQTWAWTPRIGHVHVGGNHRQIFNTSAATLKTAAVSMSTRHG